MKNWKETVRNKMGARLMRMRNKAESLRETAGHAAFHKSAGIDGLIVVVGLCIIALVVCVLMKDQLGAFVTTLMGDMTTKGQEILGSGW